MEHKRYVNNILYMLHTFSIIEHLQFCVHNMRGNECAR